ncbi:hypothetical protein JXO59_07440 [candidate division KSB1 bacterium]|nr:hypothetical protein [candidate division KSB1 bacterium]
MSNLYGTYRVSLDPKRRLAIPAKLRYAFPEGQRNQIFITRGIEKCITGYDHDEWIKLISRINKQNIDEYTKRNIQRELLGRAKEETFDKQGRILLPEDLVQYADLLDCAEVLVMGTGKKLEIWNPAVYEVEQTTSKSSFQETMTQIPLESEDESPAPKSPSPESTE